MWNRQSSYRLNVMFEIFLLSSEIQIVLDHRSVSNILICEILPCIFLHFDGESRSISITGPLTHCNPAEQFPQKKFVSGLKQEPHSSFSCLVASKSKTNNSYGHHHNLYYFLFSFHFIKNSSRNFILEYLRRRSFWVRSLFQVENKSRDHHKGSHLRMLLYYCNIQGISDPLPWISLKVKRSCHY